MPFPEVSNVPINSIFAAKRIYTFGRGEVIIQAGDDTKYMYHIDRGFVKAYSITRQGFLNVLTILVKNQLFPLLQMIKLPPDNLFYEAMDDVSLRRITLKQLVDTINSDPELAKAVLHQTLSVLHAYGERIKNLELRSAEERVVNRLLFLSKRFGLKLDNGGVVILAPFHHQDIADSVNATRETVSRVLAELGRRDITGTKDHYIVIKNPELLAKILESGT